MLAWQVEYGRYSTLLFWRTVAVSSGFVSCGRPLRLLRIPPDSDLAWYRGDVGEKSVWRQW